MTWDLETHVVVVGAGGCGMVAALSAAEASAEVILLEKDTHRACNTARSGGMIPASGTRFQKAAGIDETPADMADEILRMNEHQSDPALTMLLCNRAPELVEWLVDSQQVDLELVTDFKYPGHDNFRMHAPPARTGDALVRDLRAAICRQPSIELVDKAPATSLIVEHGEVVGVTVRSRSEERIKAKKVILATNGFGGNHEMVKQYCPEVADALYFGGEGNTGEGICWGIDAGGAVDCMHAFQGHATVAHPHGVLVSYAIIMNGGILVNQHGKRFGNEAKSYSGFALKVLAQPGGVAYEILDQRLYDYGQIFPDFCDTIAADAIKRGETIEDLARIFHVDPATLRQTVDDYNAAIPTGMDDFGRTKFVEPLRPPYYGVEVTGALLHTQGGLVLNRHAQVLRQDGTPVPNLYAGGGVACGISGKGPSGYWSGNGLLTALGYGRIAGEHAGLSATAATPTEVRGLRPDGPSHWSADRTWRHGNGGRRRL